MVKDNNQEVLGKQYLQNQFCHGDQIVTVDGETIVKSLMNYKKVKTNIVLQKYVITF